MTTPVALLGFATGNVGDDVQAFAAALHLPWIDRFVERDRLAGLRLAEPHLVVMNSWFTRQWLRPPSEAVLPVFHGFCAGRREITYGIWPRWLARHAPIGVRDTGSIARLARAGIASHWTGCLTLSLGDHVDPVPAAERRGVILLDLPAEAEAAVPPALLAGAERLTHTVPAALRADPLARMAHLARIMDRLRGAELVITRRLHAALPAAGFGTPVMTLVENSRPNRYRFTGFDTFLNLRFFRSRADLAGIDWSALGPVAVPSDITGAVTRLRKTLADRLGAVSTTRYPRLAAEAVLAVPLPAGATGSSLVAIDTGMARVTRPAIAGPNGLTARFDTFAGFERFRLPVLVEGRDGTWIEAGRTDQLMTTPALA